MNIKPIFKDDYSKMFLEQIQKIQTRVYAELDKQITIQLLEQLLEKGFVPCLIYYSSSVGTLPLAYSKKEGESISAHVPIPKLELRSESDYKEIVEYYHDLITFKESLRKFKEEH